MLRCTVQCKYAWVRDGREYPAALLMQHALCPQLTQHCEQLELVRVSVTDYAHVKVTIDDSLTSVSIERSPNLVNTCPGRAAVRAVLGCGLHSDEATLDGAPLDIDSALPPM